MRFLKSTVLVLLSVLLFLVAVCLILAGLMALDQQLTARVIHVIAKMSATTALVSIGGGLFAFIVSLVLYSVAGRPSDSAATFTFESERGPIDISLRAIEDYIAKHFAGKTLVHSIRTRVATSRDRKQLRVRASIGVWAEQNLKNSGEAVQRELSFCLKEGLGLDNVETIRVSVDKIIASKSSKPSPEKAIPDELP